MSVANIYQKIMELENRIKTIAPCGPNSTDSSSLSIPKDLLDRIAVLENKPLSVIPQELTDRIQSIENKLTQNDLVDRISSIELKQSTSSSSNNIQELIDKLQILENRPLPPDLSDRVLMIESKQTPNEIPTDLLDRLNKLELRVIPPDLTERIINIETDEFISQLPSIYNRVDVLENRSTPPDLSVRVSALEARLMELNNPNEKISMLENSILQLKDAYYEIHNKLTNLQSPPPQQLEVVPE